MVVEFLAKFSRDLSKIQSKSLRRQLVLAIDQVENAKAIKDIPNVKKLDFVVCPPTPFEQRFPFQL